MLGKLQWLIPQDELYGMCSEHLSGNETAELELEAGVTNAENGQLVRAFASTLLHKRNIRMDFSLPSPAVIHPDMPFMAWVIIPWFSTNPFFSGSFNIPILFNTLQHFLLGSVLPKIKLKITGFFHM